jgi:hypothetical protein
MRLSQERRGPAGLGDRLAYGAPARRRCDLLRAEMGFGVGPREPPPA